MSDLNNQNEAMDNEEVVEIAKSSTISKMINIIVAPSKALAAIKQKPNILFPILLVIIIPVLYYVGFWSTIEVQMIKELEDAFALQGAETTQEMMDGVIKFAKWGTPLGVVFMLLVGGLISATYYFICSKIAKSAMSFKHIISLTFHVLIISSLSWILIMVLTLVGVDVVLDVPMTSLASLLPASLTGTFLYGIILPVEIFSIWGSVVTYFGLRIIGDMNKKASMISVITAFVIGILFSGGSMLLQNLLNSLA